MKTCTERRKGQAKYVYLIQDFITSICITVTTLVEDVYCLVFCAKLPVEKASQNADLKDYNQNEDNFVGEHVQIHFPEYSSASPKLHISLHQPEIMTHCEVFIVQHIFTCFLFFPGFPFECQGPL